MTRVKDIYGLARRYGACDLFSGKESAEQLIKLFLSPQGIEFCQNTGYPDLETIRSFKDIDVSRYGVYIDADIQLHNPAKTVLVGDTTAELVFDDEAEMRHEVIVMYGAKAVIKASCYAVVFLTNIGGTIEQEIKEHAIIL